MPAPPDISHKHNTEKAMNSATLSTTRPITRPSADSRGSFTNALRSEWFKLATLRSTHLTLGLGLLLSLATSAVVCVALGSTQDDWSPDFSPITTSMVGMIFGLIIYSVFGVMTVSREYANGTIRVTLTANPDRRRVFLAKLTLVSATIMVFGLLTTTSMFLASQAILGAYGMPTASLTDPDAARMVLGLGLVMPFFPIMGLAFGMLLRSTAGGITTVLGLLWLPQIFGELVPLWFQEHVLSLLPSNGLDSVTIGHIEPSPAFSHPILGGLIAGTWLVVVVGAAYLAFLRRDA
ncbi:hypothetical protein AYO38_11525 [bacterium SCGC AG-212-C10]|nr:hypothetical protein AYO38_11525 [bacterium SCGC AG-212-C10]